MTDITYSGLLLELFSVVTEVKRKENPNYKQSELFNSLYELLYLDKICEDYLSRYNDLNSEELATFNNLAKLNGERRRKLKADYKNTYKLGLIDKKFLEEYPNNNDYVSAVFLNELKDSFLSPTFTKVFNQRIKKVYIEQEALLSKFKNLSINYKKINIKDENIGLLFKSLLKEFELLTSIYKANGLDGISYTEYYNNLLNRVSRNNYNNENNLTSIFLKLQKSKYWFSNKYLSLMLNITNRYSSIGQMALDEDILPYAIGLFINYLLDEKFLKAVTYEVDGSIEFKDLSNLVDILKKYKIDESKTIYEIASIINKVDEIFQKVISGEIKVEKQSNGYGTM